MNFDLKTTSRALLMILSIVGFNKPTQNRTGYNKNTRNVVVDIFVLEREL